MLQLEQRSNAQLNDQTASNRVIASPRADIDLGSIGGVVEMEKMPEMFSAAAVLSVLRCCFFCCCCLLATPRAAVASAAPTPTVCANSGTTSVMLEQPLSFCGNTGMSCCDAVEDDALREKLDAMNVPDTTCAALTKSFLCERCIPYLSADPTKLSVPPPCTSAKAQPSAGSGSGTTTTKPAQEQDTSSMCLERISNASFDAMTAHPDGSGRVFLTRRDSKQVWLATIPPRGGALQINHDGSAWRRPFLDLTEDHGGVLELVGVAFHPEFTTNGRLFVSYIRGISPTARGSAGAGNRSGRSRQCRYYLVVAEFSARGGAGADFSKATRADPSEVRRIFTLGLPGWGQFKKYSYRRHGGQILFRPSINDGDNDGYLYLITGYGYSLSNKQNGSSSGSFLGKILRLNVGNGPAGGREWPDTDGRHTEWTDKPDPDVFAVGLSNPSTCSFDPDRPRRLFCAAVNEQRSEIVYLITKQLGGTVSSSSIVAANVSVIVNRGPANGSIMPSIMGGLVYRGSAEPTLKGRYLYVYASRVWSVDRVEGGRYASTQVANDLSCSRSSPVKCSSSRVGNGIGRILSMAEDIISKDAFFLTTAGVFRVVPSGSCGARPQPLPEVQWPPGTSWLLAVGATALALAVYVWSAILGGGGQIHIGPCCSCRNFCFINSITCCSPRYSRCPHKGPHKG